MFGDLEQPYDTFLAVSAPKQLNLNSESLENWPKVESALKTLLANCQTAQSVEDVKMLVHKTSELQAALHERSQILLNNSHANLSDSKAKLQETNFRECVVALAMPFFHDIYRALSAANFWKEAIQDLAPTFGTRIENMLHIFHPDIPQITIHIQSIEDQIGFSLNLPKIKIAYKKSKISDFNRQL